VNDSLLHQAAAEVLQQGEALLRTISDANYTRKLRPAFNSAIGGHYRHCIDHFRCLLQGLKANEINYDHRKRDPRIETDREFALAETQRILSACQFIPTPFLRCPINVRSQIAYDADESPIIGSTVGRELMYAVAHTVHHYALIAVMCGLLDVPVPIGFGIAPSTLQYRTEQRKAA
jgi:uncharacterized damage-inducible protein DinB